ncbi:hypothetical protein [Flavobacterium notoginsengisoli]|uniref:hypothetical protein n=1 Tax=Flavobacterium notoginsengisoli TaxID=1478199 RepID=UPI00364458DA
MTYKLTGNTTIVGIGNDIAADMSSIRQNLNKVYEGKGWLIVRPKSFIAKSGLKANVLDFQKVLLKS